MKTRNEPTVIFRRQFEISSVPHFCTLHLINGGITVDRDNRVVKIEFVENGPVESFRCSLDRQTFLPCKRFISRLGSGIVTESTIFPSSSHSGARKCSSCQDSITLSHILRNFAKCCAPHFLVKAAIFPMQLTIYFIILVIISYIFIALYL